MLGLSGLHDERLFSYFKAVNFLFLSYTTKDVITFAVRYLEKHRPVLCTAPTVFVERIYTRALKCDLVYDKKRVKPLLVKGFDEAVCDRMRLYLSRNPSDPITQ